MNEKMSYAFKQTKSVFIIVLILWIMLSIVLIAPVSIAWVDAIEKGEGTFLNNLMEINYQDVLQNLKESYSREYIENTLKCEGILAFGLLGCAIIGMIKTMPKHDYAGIENGSSDWAAGEQYSILSKNKGIILAEKHYLPVDKRGNVNVLVVGRFWFW